MHSMHNIDNMNKNTNSCAVPVCGSVRPVKKYLEIAKIHFKVQSAWRLDLLVNLTTAVTRILFAHILWTAIFDRYDSVAGLDFHSMLSYYVVGSFLFGIDMSRRISEEICNRVIDGTFSKYMLIPANAQGYFQAQNFGITAFYLAFNLVAAFVWVYVFQIDFAFSAEPANIAASVLMAFLGLVFMAQLHFLIGILSFKFLEIGFFRMIADNGIAFVTGSMIPLVLLPETAVSVMRFFPFYYVGYLPSMLAIGRNKNEALSGLVVIALWVFFFFVLNRAAYRKMRTLYEGVGV